MIYFVRAEGTQFVKIGFTSGPVEKRIASLQTGSPHRLVLEETISAGTREEEKHLHALFADVRTSGEWFEIDEDDVESVTRYWGAKVLDEPIAAHTNTLKKLLDDIRSDPYGRGHCAHAWCSSWKVARDVLERLMWNREAVCLATASGFTVARICQRLHLNAWMKGSDGWLKPKHVDLALRAIESARPMGATV